jgi:hypothetical protein
MAKEPSKNHPISIVPFWKRAIREGWEKSREKFGVAIDILLVVTAIGLLVIAWWSKNHPNFSAEKGDNFMSYWFALIPVGLWFGWHVLKAPYEIYLELFEKHESENEEKERKITALVTEIESFKSVNKRRFLAFMAQLLGEIGNIHPVHWFQFFRDKIPNIRHESALIEDNFTPKDQGSFQNHVNTLCDVANANSPEGIPFVISKIGMICEFVKNPPNFQ